jgi:hypothetical protein
MTLIVNLFTRGSIRKVTTLTLNTMTLSTIYSVVAFHEMLEDTILCISILKTELSHLTLFNIVDILCMSFEL